MVAKVRRLSVHSLQYEYRVFPVGYAGSFAMGQGAYDAAVGDFIDHRRSPRLTRNRYPVARYDLRPVRGRSGINRHILSVPASSRPGRSGWSLVGCEYSQENSNAQGRATKQSRTQKTQATQEARRSAGTLYPDAGEDCCSRARKENMTGEPPPDGQRLRA